MCQPYYFSNMIDYYEMSDEKFISNQPQPDKQAKKWGKRCLFWLKFNKYLCPTWTTGVQGKRINTRVFFLASFWQYLLYHTFFEIHGHKMQFFAGSQVVLSQKLVFRHFVLNFLNVFLSGVGSLDSVSNFQEMYFDEKMSSVTGLKKLFEFPPKIRFSAVLDYPGPVSRISFST